MKFDEKYPELVSPLKRFPNKLVGPHPEIEAEPDIVQTWRAYPCAVCRTRTGWRDDSDGCRSPVCSEECVAVLKVPRSAAEPEEEPCVAPPALAS